jgi:predicted NAD/FAD-dependent oxidoreductase
MCPLQMRELLQAGQQLAVELPEMEWLQKEIRRWARAVQAADQHCMGCSFSATATIGGWVGGERGSIAWHKKLC